MRLILSIIAAFIISCSPKYDVVRKEAKSIISPFGTVWLRDSLFIDISETTNISWREFSYDINYHSSNSIISPLTLPDTNVWSKVLIYCESYMVNYYRHPSFNEYPVVGLNKTQADAYCKWRTFRANQQFYIQENKIKEIDFDTLLNFPIHFIYRLPTREEWKFAASAGLNVDSFPFGYERITDTKRKYLIHKINCLDTNGIRKFGEPLLNHYHSNIQSTKSPYPNSYGLYQMIGNVAEMINIPGVSLGGSFISFLTDSEIKDSIYYSEPQAWLGFRCIAEIVDPAIHSSLEFLNYDFSGDSLNLDDANLIKVKIDSLPIQKIKLKPVKNVFSIKLSEIKNWDSLDEILSLSEKDTIVGFEYIYYQKQSGNIYYGYSNNKDFTYLFRGYLKFKIKVDDQFTIKEIKIRRNSQEFILPQLAFEISE